MKDLASWECEAGKNSSHEKSSFKKREAFLAKKLGRNVERNRTRQFANRIDDVNEVKIETKLVIEGYTQV